VWGWGDRDEVLGATSGCYGPGPCLTPPIRVPGLSGVTNFHTSISNEYAVKSDGTVWARGASDHGQRGPGRRAQGQQPQRDQYAIKITNGT
jgi:alpha-tubulin suppressor-like RCC1 family protein